MNRYPEPLEPAQRIHDLREAEAISAITGTLVRGRKAYKNEFVTTSERRAKRKNERNNRKAGRR